MERKINEPFKDQRIKMVKAVCSKISETCSGYCYSNCNCWKHRDIIGHCSHYERRDGKDVIFQEVTEQQITKE